VPTYCLITGAGSSGMSWAPLLSRLPGDALLLPVPDEPDVPAMAAALLPEVRELSGPLVLVGASLGAMVAIELARKVELQGLVLIAAGFGIEVSDSLLDWIAADPVGLLPKVAKASIAAREDERMVALVARDFASRGQAVLLRHLGALGAYRPEPLDAPPPTLVIWGVHDASVPLADHVELAQRCRGAVAPVRDAGHMPFLEQPEQTAGWIRIAHLITEEGTSDGQRRHLSNLR
jgi:pimeloyl-ACP methyl ester carboxylesterase